MEGLRTYVLVTAPGRDYRVRDELLQLGYAVWLPECTVRRRTRRAVLIKHKGPLFPGYQFIDLDLINGQWREIENVRGVDGFLRRGDRPLPVPSLQMAKLRQLYARDDNHIIIEGGAICREYEKGDQVMIDGGTFDGWKGLFVERVSDRCKILLDLFERQVETLIPEALVMPA